MPSEEAHDAASRSGLPEDAGLEEVLDRYLQELADGGSPDQEAYLQAHPHLADALRGVFKTLDFVEATSRALDASRLGRGQLLGDYRIVREIGRGGMGVVYEAVQMSLDRRVALKVLPMGTLLSEHAPERFAREAQTAARLHHSNIVPVYAVGEEQGIPYYAMQYIEGRSLSQHLQTLRASGVRAGHDHFRRVARWGRQVAEALAYAHGEGTIHRDVKPSNLLLDARDNVWVTDFGLARAGVHTTLTVTGDVLGTARYMSPEQARGGQRVLAAATDIYSLGVTLYELLAWQPAFEGESREGVLSRVVFADPTPLRRVQPAIPRDLETIIGKCMEKDPAQRYASAADLAEDFRRFLAGEPLRARRTPWVVKAARYVRRHRLRVVGLGVAAGLTLLSMLLVVQIRQARGQKCLDAALSAVLFDSNPQEARRLLDEADGLGADAIERHLYRALVPLLNGQPQEAFGPLEQVLRQQPGHPAATFALAYAYSAAGDVFNGRRVFERVPERDVDTALAWLLRGLAQSPLQRSGAIDCYDRAVALESDYVPAIRARGDYRGHALLTEGKRSSLEAMLNDYDALVVFRPNSSRSFAARARGWRLAAAYATTQPDLRAREDEWLANCRRDLAEALRLRPAGDWTALVEQGKYLRYVGDYPGCVAALGEAMALNREAMGLTDFNLAHHYALALHAVGDLDAALAVVQPLAVEYPGLYSVSLHLALLLAEQGRVQEARALCRAALRNHQDNSNGLFWSVVFAELLGLPDAGTAALASFERRTPAEVTSEDARLATPAPALAYLKGELDAEPLVSQAGTDPGSRCEYLFLVALRQLGRGQRAEGLESLRACLRTQVLFYGEHRFAQLMLIRAEADPEWPTWLSGVDTVPSRQPH